MSELKARHIVDVYDSYYAENPFGERSQVYLKSEADKVIAELEKEIDKLQYKVTDSLLRDRNMALNFNNVFNALTHCKYKRCMAMASWCASEAYIHEYGSEYDEDLVAWFGKWSKRWLELAEKFKEKSDVPVL